jgi:hypothetical protein
MLVNDGGVFAKPIQPSPPKVEPPPPPPPSKPDVHVSEPPGQHLFSPPPVPPMLPPAPPVVPATVDDARQRVYQETLAAATTRVSRRLPPEDRADVLACAAAQAEQAVAVFDRLYDVATPVSAQDLRHMPPEDQRDVRQQAVAQAWQAYEVLTVDGPLVTAASGRVVVDRAVDQTRALVERPGTFTPELQDAVVDQIVAGTDGLGTRIADETSRALDGRFPTLEDFYATQGRGLAEMLRDGIRTAVAGAPEGAAAGTAWPLPRIQERYQDLGADVAVAAGFDDVDAGLEAFGIALTHDASLADWTDEQREQVLAQAVRIENALRAADTEGLLARFGPGAAFDAIFASRGDIALNLMTERRGCNADWAPVIGSGGITCSSSLIEYRTFSNDELWDGVANSLQYHFSHEFGHALNASLSGAYKGLDRKDRTPYQTIDDAAEGLPSPSQRDWDDPAWGLPARVVEGVRRQFPYQQNSTASNGEYFADTFSNWANGTLLDNDAGRALQAWMDRMVPEWIRTRLEASGLLAPAPAPIPSTPEPD